MSSKNLKSFRITLFVIVAGFILTACDWEPDINFPNFSEIFYNAYRGYYGKVINNNTLETINDAKIIVNDQLYESNICGFYNINNLPEGSEATIRVYKDGYEEYIQTVSVANEKVQELNILLIPVE